MPPPPAGLVPRKSAGHGQPPSAGLVLDLSAGLALRFGVAGRPELDLDMSSTDFQQ